MTEKVSAAVSLRQEALVAMAKLSMGPVLFCIGWETFGRKSKLGGREVGR